MPPGLEAAVLMSLEKAMQNVVNRRWLLASYLEGMPTPENWSTDTQPAPDPGPGQILVKAKWLSVDPYMRGRMSPAPGYTKGVGVGEVMAGGGGGGGVGGTHTGRGSRASVASPSVRW